MRKAEIELYVRSINEINCSTASHKYSDQPVQEALQITGDEHEEGETQETDKSTPIKREAETEAANNQLPEERRQRKML